MKVSRIPIASIVPDPNQPRRTWPEADDIEMAQSLLAHKQLVPVVVYEQDESYMLVDGGRRYSGAKRANLDALDAVVLPSKPSAPDLLMLQLTINCMRTDLLPLEKTEAYARLMESLSMSASELAKKLGVSKSNVTRYLSHASLPDDLKARLNDGTLSSANAYALSRMTEEQRGDALKEIGPSASRSYFERLARKPKKKAATKPNIRNLTYELPDCSLAIRTSKAISVDVLIDALADLLRACKKAKAQKLDLGTMALVVRDKTRALKEQQDLASVQAVDSQ